MREILFRGKTKDGKWVYGAYCHYDDIVDSGKDDCDYIIEKHNGEHFPFLEVIPETVGQFTGLTDKNGKKIFDGDIVKVTVCSSYDCYVCFKDYEWYFVPFDEKVKEVKFGVLKHADYEVIGNIHNNPELLEVGNGRKETE